MYQFWKSLLRIFTIDPSVPFLHKHAENILQSMQTLALQVVVIELSIELHLMSLSRQQSMVMTLGFLHLEDMNNSSTESYLASHNLAHAAAVSIYRSKPADPSVLSSR